jgi:hypothetical protein
MFLLKGKGNYFIAIARAHRDFLKNLRTLKRKRRKIETNKLKLHDEIYRRSIVFDYFLRKKQKFNQLDLKK